MSGFKKSLLTFLLLLLASSLKAQQSGPQAVFDRANVLLQQGKITQSLNKYHQLTNYGHLSGALFINMGYSYLMLGETGKAKYYFLKAKRFEKTAEKAQEALNFIDSQLSHQSVVLPPLPWERALDWLQITLGATMVLVIGLILLNAGTFALIGNWFRKNSSSSFVSKAAVSCAATGIMVILLSFYVDYRRQRYSKAVMVTQQAKVLKKPDSGAALISKAYEGYSFTVDHEKSESNENWMYVRMSNGSRGWIRRKEIMIL